MWCTLYCPKTDHAHPWVSKGIQETFWTIFGLVLVWAVGNSSIWSPVKHRATASAEERVTSMGWKKALFWGHLRARIKAEIKKTNKTQLPAKLKMWNCLQVRQNKLQPDVQMMPPHTAVTEKDGRLQGCVLVFVPTLHSEAFWPPLLLPAMERKPPAPSMVAQSLW